MPRGDQNGNQLGRPLTSSERAVIEGELLGDGHVRRGVRHSSFVYGTAQEEYRDWLANWFEEAGFTTKCKTRELDSSTEYRFRTLAYQCLHEIGTEWYNDNKRVPDSFELSPLSLRHWFIGDGSWFNEGKRNQLTLYTNAFSPRTVEQLADQLAGKAGVMARVDGRNRIQVSTKQSVHAFFSYISELPSELEPVYGYKWPEGHLDE